MSATPMCSKEEQKKAKYPWELDSSISPSDYARIVSIPSKSSDYIIECERRPAIKIPEAYPRPWNHSKRFMPVSQNLLPESPLKNSIPVLRGPQAKSLSEQESDCRHFWNMLVATIPQLKPSLKPGSAIRILDVCCGKGWAAIPLHSYFGRSPYGIPGRNVDYIGIDLEIGIARIYHKDRPDLRFEEANATRLDDYPFLKVKFDVIVIRHPEVFLGGSLGVISRTWYKIFKESLVHLAAGGIILITAYRCDEHMGADKAMLNLGAKRLFAASNPFSANIKLYQGPDLDWRDRFVAVYTKDDRSGVTGKQKIPTAEIGKRKVSARLGDGSVYEVTAIGMGSLVYHELVSGRKKIISFDARNRGQLRQLASNGVDTFVFLSGGSERDLIYRINWEKGLFEPLSIDEGIFGSAVIEGFHVIDGMLLGKAKIHAENVMQIYSLNR